MAEWTVRAQEVLRRAESGDPEAPPRRRLVDALWDDDPSAWARVLVGDGDITQQLEMAETHYLKNPLLHVRTAAEFVAEAYDRSHVDSACVALGLALTARQLSEDGIQRVAADTGFGRLGQFEDMSNGLHTRLLGTIYDTAESAADDMPQEDLSVGVLRRGLIIDKTLIALSLCTRIGFASAVALSGWGQAWWLVVVALLLLLGSRPVTMWESILFAPRLALIAPLKLPWMPLLSLFTAGFGYSSIALQILACWFVVAMLSHVADQVVGRHSRFDRSVVPELPVALITVPQLWISALTLPRFQLLSLSVAAGVAGAAATDFTGGNAVGTAAATIALASVWATRGQWVIQKLTAAAVALAWLLPHLDIADVALSIAVGGFGALAGRWVTSPSTFMVVRPSFMRRRLRRLARTVASGHPGEALQALTQDRVSPDEVLIAAWANLELGRPGNARRILSLDPTSEQSPAGRYIRLAASNRLGDEDPIDSAVPATTGGDLGRLIRLELLKAELRLGRGDAIDVATQMAHLIPYWIGRKHLFVAATVGIEMSAALRGISPKAAAATSMRAFIGAVQALHGDLWRSETMKIQDHLQVRDRSFWSLTVKGFAAALIADAAEGDLVGNQHDLAVMALGGRWGATFAHFLNPLDFADYCHATALATERATGGVSDVSLNHWIQTLATLNVARHQLRNVADRELWWSRFNTALQLTLQRATERRDWRVLAEILEVARFQLSDPQAPNASEGAVSLAIRGRSRFAECQYPIGENPRAEDFESVILRSVGEGGYWWSTWATDDYLYWTVVPQRQSEAVAGGRMHRMEWRSDAHRELFEWLPVLRDDESIREMVHRVARSPLALAPGADEYAMAELWGELIPPTLHDASRRHRTARLKVGAALSPELAPVPWAWVVIDSKRLVEVADLVVVPPASLVRPAPNATGAKPVLSAVLNPAGNLPDVEVLAKPLALDHGVSVISGRASGDPMTSIADVLRSVPVDSTTYFACHTARSADGELGLQIEVDNDGRSTTLLTFSELSNPESPIRLPRQVVAMACASSDLSAATHGEWAVLGAGLLTAGADRALVTAYLHFGDPLIDMAIIQAINNSTSLIGAVGGLQLDLLRRWQDGQLRYTPIKWAGLQVFGMTGEAQANERAPHRWVEASFLQAIESAARWHSRGADEVTLDALLKHLGTSGYADEMTLVPKLRLKALALAEGLRYEWYRRNHAKNSRPTRISDDLMQAINEACDLTRSFGGQVLTVQALYVTALRHDTRESRRLRRITGWRPLSPHFVDFMLERSDDIWHETGVAKTPNLNPGEAERVYAAFNVKPPTGKDHWFHKDRIN